MKRNPFYSDKYMPEYFSLSKRFSGHPYPDKDSEGNEVSDIQLFNIAGVTHTQPTGNPQKYIPKLTYGDRLILVPDPENKFDNEAIRVMTRFGNQIGWYPRDLASKRKVFHHLMERKDVYAHVYEVGKTRDGQVWWCEIRVVTYANGLSDGAKTASQNMEELVMALLSKPKQKPAQKGKACKLCNRPLQTPTEETEICLACGMIMDTDLKTLLHAIPLFQDEANKATSVELKIAYLRAMLDHLYAFKVKYVDNDVNPLEQNIDDLIDEVVDCISYARE